MILRIALNVAVLVGITLIQTTWLSAIALFGAKPDLGLLAVVWMAYRHGPVIGSSAAFISGLIDDAVSAAPLGFNAFVKGVVAWASSFLHGALEFDRILMPLLLGAVATLLKAFAALFLHTLFGGGIETYDLLSSILWTEVAYNAVLAPVLFWFLRIAYDLVEGTRRRNS
jgi:rod shape-determining protein MreD